MDSFVSCIACDVRALAEAINVESTTGMGDLDLRAVSMATSILQQLGDVGGMREPISPSSLRKYNPFQSQ